MNLPIISLVMFLCAGVAFVTLWVLLFHKGSEESSHPTHSVLGAGATAQGAGGSTNYSQSARAYAAQATLLHEIAYYLWGLGKLPAACVHFERAVRFAQLSGDQLLIVSALSKFAAFQQTNDLLFEAGALLEQAESVLLRHSELSTHRLCEGVEDQREQLIHVTALTKEWRTVGLLLGSESDSLVAERKSRQILSELHGRGWDDWRVAGVINLLACAVAARGNWCEARQHWEQASQIISEWPYANPDLVENIKSNLAFCRQQLGW